MKKIDLKMTLDKDVRIVRPRFIKDYTGKEWFRPGVGIHHSQLLELSTRKLMTISKTKEEIVISAEVWNGVTSTKLRWKQWMEERKNNPDFPSGTAQCIGLVLEDGRPLRARTEELKEKFGVLFKTRHI